MCLLLSPHFGCGIHSNAHEVNTADVLGVGISELSVGSVGRLQEECKENRWILFHSISSIVVTFGGCGRLAHVGNRTKY